MPAKKLYMRSFGCQMNDYDSSRIADLLRETLDAERTENLEEADLVVINTCSIREKAQEKVFSDLGRIREVKKLRPWMLIAVGGCVASQEGKDVVKRAPWVDVVFGPQTLHRLPALIEARLQTGKPQVDVSFPEIEKFDHLPQPQAHGATAFVSIMEGCSKYCSYCIVPYTRGKERSRAMEDILQELRELKAQGYREVTLLGQNVNAYGKDLGIEGGFAALLRESAKTGIDRIRFTTSHPWDFSDEMIDAIASCDNIMPFIHLPVQSGDSDVLRRMGRRYTIEQYRSLFDRIKAAIPGCAVSTDIIVGFPNESDEQFAHTMDIVDYCRFDNAYTFIYSPREGTPAARMADSVPMEVKQERLARLNERWNAYALENNQAYVGRIVKVLVDGPSKKDEHIYSGYTETNKMINFTADKVQAGEIIEVKITQARTWSLNGEAI